VAAADAADGVVALCSIDPLTQIDHSATKTVMPENGVLIVDNTDFDSPRLLRRPSR
jgi:hypothetical protein